MKGLTTFCLFQIEYLFLNSNLFCFVVITLILKNGKIQYIIYKSGSRYFRYNSLNCRIKNAIFIFFCYFYSAIYCIFVHSTRKLSIMETLYRAYRTLLNNTSTDFVRYLHDQIEWDSRLIAILGARGIGKTTMLLQHIKQYDNIDETLFVTADDLYFSEHRIFDLAMEFYQHGGKKLYIDEIHKYYGWSREIKNIYDLIPGIQVVYTGSSILDLETGEADLSRRKLEYRMTGLSFREYLAISRGYRLPVYSLEDILKNKVDFPYNLERPLQLFKEYLQQGYYPFFKEKGYYIRLRSILNQALENDIPIFAKMNITTAQKLKRLLYIIAQSVPFKPNFTKLAALLDINRNTISELMFYLEKAGIINQLRCDTEGIRLLGKVDKVYLNNTNLAYALSDSMPDIGNIRETVFFSLMRATQPITTSSCSDFSIGKYTFEIGGKGKSQKQIQNIENSYIVKDDIEFGMQNIIPLWMFGFTY